MRTATVVELNNVTSAEANHKLRHDLLAPLCNIKAYTNELKQVGMDIEALLLEHKDALPEAVADAFRNIAIADIKICTQALDRSSESLESQLQVVFSDKQQP